MTGGWDLPSLPRYERALVIGVLNVTPDSFSDGGLHLDAAAAIARGRALRAAGADLLEVGGESTRPGAGRVAVAEELRRVLPVVTALAGDGPVGVDTTRAQVAAAALAAGAVFVNDVSGGRDDPAMIPLLADSRVPYVLMHSRGPSLDMASRANYGDVVAQVRTELAERLAELAAAGVAPERVVLDPGLGFAKSPAHNWELLARLDELASLGRPLLIGASSKSFLGALLADEHGPRPVGEREDATTAISALAAAAGAWAVRVHEVRAARDAVEVAAAWTARGGLPEVGCPEVGSPVGEPER